MAGNGRAPSVRAAADTLGLLNDSGRAVRLVQDAAHEQVSDIQRARMLAAMFDAASELGIVNVSVAQVVGRAGVSRRTFYEMFGDREDCFLAAFDEAVRCALERVLAAAPDGAPWRERMRKGLVALLEFLDDEPGMARVLVVEALAAGPRALERRRTVLGRLIGVVDEGRSSARSPRELNDMTAEGVVGAVFSVVHARMLEEPSQPLAGMLGPLMGMIVLPYLGAAAARREIERPAVVRAPEQPGATISDPMRGLEMRVTYRTVRVLLAIASSPSASNREISALAGVSDQGQMSKLLARLQQNGLIENDGGRIGRGERNAWTLTDRGAEFERSIHARGERT
jgi:AcrR family transcriptional regulator